MKKLVLILVCAVLLTFFIAFNYLLWDKEKNTQSIQTLESSNEDKNATIGALGREIKNLEDFSKQLTTKLQITESKVKDLEADKSEMEKRALDAESLLKKKNDTIEGLKQLADLNSLEEVIVKWVDYVNNGQYPEAYKLMSPQAMSDTSYLDLSDFTNTFKNSIKSMKIASIKLNTEEVTQSSRGIIQFVAELDVEKLQTISWVQLEEGVNKKYFTLEYDGFDNNWIISRINTNP